jgi:hypothetical protein
MPNTAPCVAFLGAVERYHQVPEGGTNFLRYNLLGLKTIVSSPIFPLPLQAPALALAFYDFVVGRAVTLRIRDNVGAELASIALHFGDAMPETANIPGASHLFQGHPLPLTPKTWTFTIVTLSGMNRLVERPGTCNIVLVEEDGHETLIGQLSYALVDPEPFTESRKAAIRSDPRAAKLAHGEMRCGECNGEIKAYVAFERQPDSEANGCVWYENLQDSYNCPCGNLKVDLSIWRKNLHGLLGMRVPVAGHDALVPLYEKGALTRIYHNFASLLQTAACEETFQKFLEENPVVLHQFSAEKLFLKAPILSLRKTDFAIVNHQHELILIELEKPDTRLMKADGNIHSELQHAMGQAREWLHHADEHRLAVLQCIGVGQNEVGAVRAVVIAGKDRDYEAEHLRRLKGDAGYARVKVLTYDDLLANFGTLIRGIDSL